MKLALIDNNAESLSEAKSSLMEIAKQHVETYHMDVSKMEEWKDVKGAVEKRFGAVDFLMLNAGIGTQGTYEDVEYFHKVRNGSRNFAGSGGEPTTRRACIPSQQPAAQPLKQLYAFFVIAPANHSLRSSTPTSTASSTAYPPSFP